MEPAPPFDDLGLRFGRQPVELPVLDLRLGEEGNEEKQ